MSDCLVILLILGNFGDVHSPRLEEFPRVIELPGISHEDTIIPAKVSFYKHGSWINALVTPLEGRTRFFTISLHLVFQGVQPVRHL